MNSNSRKKLNLRISMVESDHEYILTTIIAGEIENEFVLIIGRFHDNSVKLAGLE